MMALGVPDWLNELMRRFLALPEQVSTYARAIDALHYLEILAMVGLTALIGALVVVFCLRYPRRAGLTPHIVAPLRLELTVYGGILAFFLLLWGIGYAQYLELEQEPRQTLDVYVTGKQWMWKFAYPRQGVASVDKLYVPAGRPVRLLITSRDVIHSFFVPALRLKRDAVPGMYTTLWFRAVAPGRHPILCAELCGVGHSEMLGELQVLSQDAFEAWVTSTRSASQGGIDLVEQGRAVAARHGCLVCHAIDGGPAVAYALGPRWRGMYGSVRPLLGGGRVLADEAYLTRSMMDPTAQIVEGYSPVMPSFQGLLSAPEVASLVELIKSLRTPSPEQENSIDAR